MTHPRFDAIQIMPSRTDRGWYARVFLAPSRAAVILRGPNASPYESEKAALKAAQSYISKSITSEFPL